MKRARPRAYYHEFAWAYDLVLSEPITSRIDFIEAELRARGVRGSASILDAGCGTGRYASALADRGFHVLGVDRSPEMIGVARARPRGDAVHLDFALSDLLTAIMLSSFECVLCRGMLNDLTDEAERTTIFERFAGWLRPAGVLIFDVRDWAGSLARYNRDPVYERRVTTPNGVLTFWSETRFDHDGHRLLVRECFDIEQSGGRSVVESDFVMRCWSPEEVQQHVAAAFENVAIMPSYSPDRSGANVQSDRLVVVATRKKK